MIEIELNKLYNTDCVEYMKTLKDESIDLVIADPPYFKVVNQAWDYQWKTLEEYLEWSKKWFKEAYRILRKGGTIYLYGYFRVLSHCLPILEELGFELRQQIIINKGIKAVSGRATKNYKMFPNVTESILFLVKDSKPFVKKYLKDRQKEIGIKAKDINEQLGVKSNGGGMWSIYTGNNVCKQLPTRELWEKLSQILQFDLEYEKIQMVFNTEMGVTDVWEDIDFYEEKRIHPTQKPLKVSNRLILASSNNGDLIYIPFAGSGSEIVSCINNNRNWIATEISKEYIEIIEGRIKQTLDSQG